MTLPRTLTHPPARPLADLVEAYLAHTTGGLSMRQIARAHGLAPSTVMRGIRRCEDARTDPDLDAFFDHAAAAFAA